MITECFLEWATTASVAKRAEAADALALAFLHIELEEEEREGTEATLTLLLDDPSSTVRKAIADVFCDHEDAPRHIINALAHDIAEISTMIISRSPVFLDAELVDLCATGSPQQQIAIAGRSDLALSVTAAIAEVASAQACLELLMNPGVCLKRSMLRRIAERHGDNGKIRTCLLERDDLPGEIRMILTNKLGEQLGQFVSSRKWMSEKRAVSVVNDACSKASILYAARGNDDELDLMIRDMICQGKVTTAFLLRSICMGNIALFSRVLSHLSGLPFIRVEHILSSNRLAAFKAVYDKAGLPSRAYCVFESAIVVWRQMLEKSSSADFARLPLRVTKKILAEYHRGTNPVMDDLLVLLRRFSAEAQRDQAIAKAREVARQQHELVLAQIGNDLEEAIEEALILEFASLDSEFAELAELADDEVTLTLIDDNDLIELAPSLDAGSKPGVIKTYNSLAKSALAAVHLEEDSLLERITSQPTDNQRVQIAA